MWGSAILGGQFLVCSVASTSFLSPSERMGDREVWPLLSLPAYCHPLKLAGHLREPAGTPLTPFHAWGAQPWPAVWLQGMAEQSHSKSTIQLSPGAQSSQTQPFMAMSLSVHLDRRSSSAQNPAQASSTLPEGNMSQWTRSEKPLCTPNQSF